jgi:hypothetical protein
MHLAEAGSVANPTHPVQVVCTVLIKQLGHPLTTLSRATLRTCVTK